jgi:hypothetical protein
MPRKQRLDPASVPEAKEILPNAAYRLVQARALLSLGKATLHREVRAKRLRVAKRAGQYFVMGQWLLDWLWAGEIHPRVEEAVNYTTNEATGTPTGS